jgi:hypothetical protein
MVEATTRVGSSHQTDLVTGTPRPSSTAPPRRGRPFPASSAQWRYRLGRPEPLAAEEGRAPATDGPRRSSRHRQAAEDPRSPRTTLPGVAEAFLAPLHAAGLPDKDTGLAFSLLYDCTLGFALSSPTSTNEQRVRDTAIRINLHAFFRSLPADTFPSLVALGEHVWIDNRDERFAAGLDTAIDGLEAQRRRRRQHPER